MTTYSLFGSGLPAGTAVYSGPFLCGIVFQVTQAGMWFNGYRWRPVTGGDAGPQKFALYALSSNTTGVLIPAATVTSGPLTLNQVNSVNLAAPVPLAIGTVYMATTGWTAVNGFPNTNNVFGSGDPHSAGITNGPLMAYGDDTNGGTNGCPWTSWEQGVFSASLGTDPTLAIPNQGSSSADFGMDVLVSTIGPAAFNGPYQLWPNNPAANAATVADIAVNYIIGTEIDLSQPCSCSAIRYYSPAGVTQLATRAAIWNIATGLEVAAIAAPSWSGAAGSGWLQASFASAPVLPAGKYRVSVYNGNVSIAAWSAKDASTAYWGSGSGANGITWGPISAPPTATAQLCWQYNGSAPESTPPYSNGNQVTGQSPFGQLPSGANTFPQLFVPVLDQNYWVDGLFTPGSGTGSTGGISGATGGAILLGARHIISAATQTASMGSEYVGSGG